MEFLISAKAIPIPHLRVVRIKEEGSPCMVNVARGESMNEKALSSI